MGRPERSDGLAAERSEVAPSPKHRTSDSNLPIIACDRCGTWNPLTLVNVGEISGETGDPWRSYYREAKCRCGAYLELSTAWAIPKAERARNWWDALRRTTRHDG